MITDSQQFFDELFSDDLTPQIDYNHYFLFHDDITKEDMLLSLEVNNSKVYFCIILSIFSLD
jgi:hypothetical protein